LRAVTCSPLFAVPFSFQHGIYHMIDEVVIEPFCIPDDAFLLESKTLRDGSTPAVPGRGWDCDPVEAKFLERIVNQNATASGHDSSPDCVSAQPVAQFHGPVAPSDRMVADHADDVPPIKDGAGEPLVSRVLLQGGAYELATVFNLRVAIQLR
jgi:hypothetical protein